MKTIKFFNKIDTVTGVCTHCGEDTVLVAVVAEYYRCTTCGRDTKQYINGSIRYIHLKDEEIKWLQKNRPTE